MTKEREKEDAKKKITPSSSGVKDEREKLDLTPTNSCLSGGIKVRSFAVDPSLRSALKGPSKLKFANVNESTQPKGVRFSEKNDYNEPNTTFGSAVSSSSKIEFKLPTGSGLTKFKIPLKRKLADPVQGGSNGPSTSTSSATTMSDGTTPVKVSKLENGTTSSPPSEKFSGHTSKTADDRTKISSNPDKSSNSDHDEASHKNSVEKMRELRLAHFAKLGFKENEQTKEVNREIKPVVPIEKVSQPIISDSDNGGIKSKNFSKIRTTETGESFGNDRKRKIAENVKVIFNGKEIKIPKMNERKEIKSESKDTLTSDTPTITPVLVEDKRVELKEIKKEKVAEIRSSSIHQTNGSKEIKQERVEDSIGLRTMKQEKFPDNENLSLGADAERKNGFREIKKEVLSSKKIHPENGKHSKNENVETKTSLREIEKSKREKDRDFVVKSEVNPESSTEKTSKFDSSAARDSKSGVKPSAKIDLKSNAISSGDVHDFVANMVKEFLKPYYVNNTIDKVKIFIKFESVCVIESFFGGYRFSLLR